MWQKVEVADPIFLTRKQGRERGEYIYVGNEPMTIMRVISPTVAYVKRMGALAWWSLLHEPRDTPFVAGLRREAS